MIKYYFNAAPNPTKVTLFLQESGLDFDPVPVDIRKGEQFSPEFLAVNPNAKVPAIEDDGVKVFDSNAILLYLAEKTGLFLPSDPAARGPLLSWLMFIASGVGPYSGQAVHFKRYAPEPMPYALDRYLFEVRRHYGVLEGNLGDKRYMLGDSYTIVDMALWGWARNGEGILGEGSMADFPNLKRLVDEIEARPAAERALSFAAQFDFKTENDAEALSHLFGHLQSR